MLMMRSAAVTAALCLVVALAAGCSKHDTAAPVADGKLSEQGQAALDAGRRAASVPEALRAEGLRVEAVTLNRVGNDFEVSGTLKNGSSAPVDGVNLSITFKDAGGNVVGGHSTQQFFQPAVAVGASQPIVLRAPVLPGGQAKAASADIKVLNLAKAGLSPDGWTPLDPKHMPKPRKVPGSDQQVLADGTVVGKS